MQCKFVWPCLKDRRCRLCLHFISFALLYMPNGLAWYWGNLVVYLNSYWYANNEHSNFQTPWFLSVFNIFWSTSLILGGNLIKRMDRRIFTLIGILMYDAGILLSYFSVAHSLTAVTLTLGVMPGLGVGFIQTEVITRIPKLVTSKHGIAFALLTSFTNGGTILLSSIITWYTNPQNSEADVNIGWTKVFSKKSVIDRVPFIFLALGSVTSILHLSGFTLSFILNNKEDDDVMSKECEPTIKTNEIENIDESTSINTTKDIDSVDRKADKPSFTLNNIVLPSNPEKALEYLQDINDTKSPEEIKLGSKTSSKICKKYDNTNSTRRMSNDLLSVDSGNMNIGPCKMIKTLAFYIIWVTFFTSDISFVVMLNYYKTYGELWISDDHLLTNLGIASLCFVFLMRFFWALIIDKSSVKTIQVILTASMAVAFLFYTITPQISPWLLAVWMCVTITLCASVYLIFPIATLRLFGKIHFGANFGIVVTSTIVLNLIAPGALKTLMNEFGWSAVFIGTGFFNTLALIANVVGMPNEL